MKWQHKARIQNGIAALPFGSNAVYYAVQRSVGGLRPEKIDPLDRMKAGVEMVNRAAREGFDIHGKTILEVGTGRMVDLPTAMWLCGAARVVTVDLNPYLSQELVSEARAFLRANADRVTGMFSYNHDPLFESRLNTLVGTHVPDRKLMEAMSIEYLSPADASNLPLPSGCIDLHVSHTVMEHIPPDVISRILVEARRVMTPGGLLIHNIDPSDHFSHDDRSITKINFLRFSDKEWDRWAGNQFMYHNRLRAGDYARIFADAGVRTLQEDRAVDERSLSELRAGFPLADRFKGLSNEELATTTYSIVGIFA